MTHNRAIIDIVDELVRAEELHPHWPDDLIHAVGIITEEVGEAMKDAIDATYKSESHIHARDNLRVELVQAGAMCLRAIVHLDSICLQSSLSTSAS